MWVRFALLFLQCWTMTSLTLGANVTDQYPQCVELTFSFQEFITQPDGHLRLLADKGVAINESDYELSSDNKTAHVCYPMADKFKRCRTKHVLPVGKYAIQSNRSLTDVHTGQMWSLGEYYIRSPDGGAVVCIYCNYLTLKRDEYEFQSDKQIFTIVAAKKSFFSPNYAIDEVNLTANVCYPLKSPKHCPWVLLEKWSSMFLTDKRVMDKESSHIYELNDYRVLDDGSVAVCIEAVEPDELETHINKICTIIFIVSAACLAIAILVHLVLPDISFQRAPLICHAFSLLVLYVCLAFRRLDFDAATYNSTILFAVFYLTYFFGLASFSWLTVMAFDVWRITSQLRDGGEGYKWADNLFSKKMAVYGLFAWGVAGAFACFMVALDASSYFQDNIGLHPKILYSGWFNERASLVALWYAPIGVLLAVNFIFFVLAIVNLCSARNDSQPFRNVKLHHHLVAVLLVVFLAMGVFWVMEIASFLDKGDNKRWFFTDLVNAFQGVVIALVYTCSPFTWKKISPKKVVEKF